MSQMAVRGGETRSAQQISDDTGVPLPTVAKLLNLLGRAKLVTSQRGASGGYVLSAAPDNLTVAQIIQAMEGPIALTACVDGAPDCRGAEDYRSAEPRVGTAWFRSGRSRWSPEH